jgi:hypothetical protein
VRRHDSGLVILSYRRPEPPTPIDSSDDS